MQRQASPTTSARGRLVCLGEALVDLICPDSLEDPAEAERYEVRFGGALANVAVAASRAGDDARGRRRRSTAPAQPRPRRAHASALSTDKLPAVSGAASRSG